MLLGTESGLVCCYDPQLKDKGVVMRYNNKKEVKKCRKVDHVRWFESVIEGQNANKFIVVFDDGSIYVFYRDLKPPEDSAAQQTIKIPTGQH